MASNSYQRPLERSMPKRVGVHEIDVITSLSAQVTTLSKQLRSLNVNDIQTPSQACELCGGNHASVDWQSLCFIIFGASQLCVEFSEATT